MPQSEANPQRAKLNLVWIGLVATIGAGCPQAPLEDARALEAEKKWAAAGQAYISAAKKDPANLAAWDGAVRTLCEKQVHVGDCLNVLDLELDILGNLKRHHDALATALELRARARIDQGLAKSALSDLSRAVRAAPERPSAYVARAKAHIMLGERNAALEALSRAKALDGKNEEASALLFELPTDQVPGPH